MAKWRIHIIILCVYVLLISMQCNLSMEKYEWLPSECAPEKYPMRIVKGDFIFDDGQSIYIPARKTLSNGWGKIGSTHLVGEAVKPIPRQLAITWFSFTENKFYSGVFNLPQEDISALFKKGFISPVTNKWRTYDRIIVGLAPGGTIGLWMEGDGVVKAVALLIATEAAIEWSVLNDNPSITRDQYIQARLAEVLNGDEIASLKRNGVTKGLWEKYDIKYRWKPLIIGVVTPSDIWIQYFNGEVEFINYEYEKNPKVETRAITKKLELRWTNHAGVDLYSTVLFDEEEIFAALSKLYPDLKKQELQLQIEINNIDNSLTISLKNNQYLIRLQKCLVKVYSE